ncbi:MAG: DUF6371 domain-containing protein [Parabacteroides sp.]|nr:DUF6371 domain-containing protein [Parabacteroides sp.]MDY5637417.1 DUF6371 domain-containing protein [Parabacteroides sp.]
MKEYTFILEKYRTGGHNRYTCPQCGQKKCFTRYIRVETGEYVDESCGRCDHESACGYHYKPAEYFRDHPDRKTLYRPVSFSSTETIPTTPLEKPLSTIPMTYVLQSHSSQSNFMDWLRELQPDPMQLQRVFSDYLIGATKDRRVIFWQIDQKLQVRTGKTMQYSNDGHRAGPPYWIHSLLDRQNKLSSGWELNQCFFGEHLLKRNLQAPVCLVESEKTAVVLALFRQNCIWLATGGCSALSMQKCQVLKGRKVILFPDSGMYGKWIHVMERTEGIDYMISPDLEGHPRNTDIADLLVQELQGGVRP